MPASTKAALTQSPQCLQVRLDQHPAILEPLDLVVQDGCGPSHLAQQAESGQVHTTLEPALEDGQGIRRENVVTSDSERDGEQRGRHARLHWVRNATGAVASYDIMLGCKNTGESGERDDVGQWPRCYVEDAHDRRPRSCSAWIQEVAVSGRNHTGMMGIEQNCSPWYAATFSSEPSS